MDSTSNVDLAPGSLPVSAQEQTRQQVSRSTPLIWMHPAARLLPTLRIFKEAPEMTRGPVSPPSANCSWPQLWNCGACGQGCQRTARQSGRIRIRCSAANENGTCRDARQWRMWFLAGVQAEMRNPRVIAEYVRACLEE